jgi:hypothetical protein
VTFFPAGDAYAEPAKDVEGYIAYVKGQKK